MSIADELHRLTLEALNDCTDAQRHIYCRVHGITHHGATNPETASEVARTLGISKSSAQDSLNVARLTVYRHIALALIEREQQREEANRIELPGTSTTDQHTSMRAYARYGLRPEQQRVEQRITLGAGSQAMETAEKDRDPAHSNTLRIAAHIKYSTPNSTTSAPHTA